MMAISVYYYHRKDHTTKYFSVSIVIKSITSIIVSIAVLLDVATIMPFRLLIKLINSTGLTLFLYIRSSA